MIPILFELLLVALAVERTTEIFVESKLFAPARQFIANKAIPINPEQNASVFWSLFHDLTSCGYCLSVWVSIFFASFCHSKIISNPFANFIIVVMLLHGFSNLIHMIFMIIYRGRVMYMEITHTTKDKEDGL